MSTNKMSAHARGVIITFLGGLALSFDIPVVRLADGNIWSVLFMRSVGTVVVAALFFIGLRLATGRAPVLLPGRAGLAVAVLYGLGTLFFMGGVFYTTSANVAFILAFNPMFAALLSWLFLKERPSRATMVAMVAMTLGVLIIVGGGLESGHWLGDLSSALSALAIAAALTISRASRQDFGYTPLVGALVPAIVGGLMIVISSGYHIGEPGWIFVNGLALTPFAFWALAVGPKYLSAAETAMFYLLETVLAPVWVWLVFSDEPPIATLIGGAIILAALVWHSTVTLRQEKSKAH